MKKLITICAVVGLVLTITGTGHANFVWGVDPTATGTELVNIDPFTGTVYTSYSLPGGIGSSNTEIGLAGWSNELFYTNADTENGKIYVIDPDNGSTLKSYSVSGGWEVDGLGYYSTNGGDSYLYTSGCSVDDVHRYNAVDGASPQFFWSNSDDPQAMAGDNGGRIFTYSNDGQGWGIYEIDPLASTSVSWFASSPSADIVGMAYDGTYLYLSDTNNKLYTMNNSGVLVNTLDLGGYSLYALASTEGEPYVVPAPGAILLGSLGLGLVGWFRRRKTA